MATYSADCGRAKGPVRGRAVHSSIGVRTEESWMPVGMAFGVGRTEDGLAAWRLTVQGTDVPGRWIIVDREFWRVP